MFKIGDRVLAHGKPATITSGRKAGIYYFEWDHHDYSFGVKHAAMEKHIELIANEEDEMVFDI